MKNIKMLIVSIIVVIIVLIIILSIILLNIDNGNKNKVTNSTINNESIVSESLIDTKDENISSTSYYMVQKCIAQYLDFVNKNNSAYYVVNENGKSEKVVEDEYINSRIYDILSENYINKNKITKDNVYSYIDNITENVIFNILDARVIKKEKISQYIISGYIQTLQNEFIEEKFFIVNLDESNNIFSIEPILKKYDNIDQISVDDDVSIEKNENNKIPTVKINAETQCKNYLTLFKRMMLSKPEIAYDYLDKEYRDKRFGNVEEFKKYINNNAEELQGITAEEYLVNAYDDYTEFICKDKYGRIYTFNVTTYLKYTVKLDTYTIISDTFKESYNSGDAKQKILMNADKWIQMLNNRDYTAAYNVLDETFRNNSFSSEENFEEYMRENYPLHYSVTFTNYEEETNVSLVTVNLQDITGENSNIKELKIIMQLKDNYDFVMSFEI